MNDVERPSVLDESQAPPKLVKVQVEWVDATAHSGWHLWDEVAKLREANCVSVGYMLTETNDEYLYLAQSVSPGGPGEVLIIPKAWIKSCYTLACTCGECQVETP